MRANISPQLDSESTDQLLSDLFVKCVGLLVGQRLLKASVRDAVAKALLARLGMLEAVDQGDIFNAVSRGVANNFHEIILMECRRIASRRWLSWLSSCW